MKHGIFAVNKPKGITSHDVINILRKKTGIRRIGHAGTLDPLAEGVLVVAIGREFTKQLQKIVNKEKEYIAEIFLGKTSTTDDSEGKVTVFDAKIKPTPREIQSAVQAFVGKIMQTPPQYSAVKIKGQTAYKKARRGMHVELKPRQVELKQIEILNYKYPLMKLKITCGKGVYIRSLARDIGEKLKTGAYLKNLIRTRVGEFRIEQAEKIDLL